MSASRLQEIFKRAGTATELRDSLFTYIKRNHGTDIIFPMWVYGDQALKLVFQAKLSVEGLDALTSEFLRAELEVYFGSSPDNSWEIQGCTVKNVYHTDSPLISFTGFDKKPPEELLYWLCCSNTGPSWTISLSKSTSFIPYEEWYTLFRTLGYRWIKSPPMEKSL